MRAVAAILLTSALSGCMHVEARPFAAVPREGAMELALPQIRSSDSTRYFSQYDGRVALDSDFPLLATNAGEFVHSGLTAALSARSITVNPSAKEQLACRIPRFLLRDHFVRWEGSDLYIDLHLECDYWVGEKKIWTRSAYAHWHEFDPELLTAAKRGVGAACQIALHQLLGDVDSRPVKPATTAEVLSARVATGDIRAAREALLLSVLTLDDPAPVIRVGLASNKHPVRAIASVLAGLVGEELLLEATNAMPSGSEVRTDGLVRWGIASGIHISSSAAAREWLKANQRVFEDEYEAEVSLREALGDGAVSRTPAPRPERIRAQN